MNFVSASNGARVVQIAASNSMSASGLEMVRVSGIVSLNSVSTATANAYWSAGIDGADRSWTTTPSLVGQPALYITDAGIGFGPRNILANVLDSDRALLSFAWSTTVDGAATWYVAAIGAPTI